MTWATVLLYTLDAVSFFVFTSNIIKKFESKICNAWKSLWNASKNVRKQPPNFASNTKRINQLIFSLKLWENHRFADDITEDGSRLIRLNSLNITSKICSGFVRTEIIYKSRNEWVHSKTYTFGCFCIVTSTI